MVSPGFLKTADVVAWLGGIEPVWTLLDFDSYCRLRHGPGAGNRAMHLAANISAAEIPASPIMMNAVALLRMADRPGGLQLTTGGNLSRAVVAELSEICRWPTFDLELVRSITKVLNEPDVWPLELLRRVVVEARLLRRNGRSLIPTPAGRRARAAGGTGDLMARLFEITFWRINLAYWDGHPVPGWPQSDIGVIAWGLSQAARSWQTPAHLVRSVAIPVNGILEAGPETAGQILELRVLRFLAFFGLLETEPDPASTDRVLPRRRYRTAPLLERFLTFDVTLEPVVGTRH